MGQRSVGRVNRVGYGVWRGEGHAGIEYSLAVLEQIRAETVEGYRALPRGGIEIGGVLFGTELDGFVRIVAHRALDCAHVLGPGFVLSASDEAAFAELLSASDPELAGLQPVGWYHSRTRSSILLTDQDLQLHARYFQEPWQIALVTKPERTAQARAHFFAPTPERGLVSLTECRLVPALGLVPTAPEPQRSGPVPQTGPQLVPAVGRVPAAPRPVSHSRPQRMLGWSWIAAALCVVFVTVLGIGLATPRRHVPSQIRHAGVQLRAEDTNGQLLITWDRAAQPIRSSRKAVLQIVDGDNTIDMDLDREGVTKGSVAYFRKTERVDLRMTLFGNGSEMQEAVSFLGNPVQ